MKRSLLKSIVWQVLYFTLWVCILFILLESTCRLAGYGQPWNSSGMFRMHGHDKFQADEDLIWRLRERWTGTEVNGAIVHTNALGFRGDEVEITRDSEGIRILYLGDSVTYGHYLSDHQTIPFLVEQNLNARFTKPVEVINAGVPGYSTFQEVKLLRRYAEYTQPDLVIVGFCLNDVTERYSILLAYGGARFIMGGVDTATGMSIFQRLWYTSAFRDALRTWLRRRLQHQSYSRDSMLWRQPNSDFVQQAWHRTLGEVSELITLTDSLDIQLAMILYPYSDQLHAPMLTNAPQSYLMSFLMKKRIPTLNLLADTTFQASADSSHLYLDKNHFSAQGSKVAADLIATFLLEELLQK